MSKIGPRLLTKEEKGIIQGEWQGGEGLWDSKKTMADAVEEFVTQPLYTAFTHSQPRVYTSLRIQPKTLILFANEFVSIQT